jgi:hypothetical protein
MLHARLALLAGRRDRARIALKAALRCNPVSFSAHFLLGRLYWRDRSVVKAKREFDLAWQVDPGRFERAYARLRGRQEGAPELFAYPGAPEEVHVTARQQPRRYYGDFRDEEERRRFADLPPINRDDIHEIDWDSFEERLDRD